MKIVKNYKFWNHFILIFGNCWHLLLHLLICLFVIKFQKNKIKKLIQLFISFLEIIDDLNEIFILGQCTQQKSTKFLSLLHIHKILYDIIKHNKIYILFMLFIRACLYVCVYNTQEKVYFLSSWFEWSGFVHSSAAASPWKFIQNKSFQTLRGGRKKIPLFLFYLQLFPRSFWLSTAIFFFVQQFVFCNYSHSVIL